MSVLGLSDTGRAHVRAAAPPTRVLGGACAEVARRLNASVEFIRCLLVIASLLSPKVFWAYVAVVLVIPHGARRLPGAGNVVGVARVGLLVAALQIPFAGSVNVDELFKRSPELWIPQAGLSLVALLALFRSWQENDERDRELAAAALALLAVAGILVLGTLVVPGVRWERVAQAATVLLGLGLIGLGRGRYGRALTVCTAVGAGGVLWLSASGVRLQGGIGRLDAQPASAGAVHSAYRRAIGRIDLDLSRVRSAGRVIGVTVSVGIGHVDVLVPDGAQVTLDAHIGRGTLMSPDTGFASGLNLHQVHVYPSAPGSGPVLRYRIASTVGIGSISVGRAASGSNP